MPKGEGVLYKKGTSELWMNKSKDYDKKSQYSCHRHYVATPGLMSMKPLNQVWM